MDDGGTSDFVDRARAIAKAREAILAAAPVDGGFIEVDVDGSRMTLRGKVVSEALKRKIGEAARSACPPDIREIDNAIAVDPNLPPRRV